MSKWWGVFIMSLFLSGCVNSSAALQDGQIRPLQIGSQTLQVEIVTQPSSAAQGLSGRTSIGSDGMLFLFQDSKIRHFWMKDMQFAIDMIWIADGEVIGVTENVQPPGKNVSLSDLPTYASPAAATMVLEVPAGMSARYGFEAGTQVKLLVVPD